MNMAKSAAPASRAAPRPKIRAPRLIAFGRPRISATFPAKKEEMAAGMRMVETIRPWTVDETEPKLAT
jgi:hypothetical protein